MNKKAEILRLYYEEHQKQTAIAEKLEVRQSYISKIVTHDGRYEGEKSYRSIQSKIKKKEYNKLYYKTHPRTKKDTSDKEEYERLQAQLDNDIKLLSSYNNEILNEALVKWLPSAYHVNKKGNLLLDKVLRGSMDLPRLIRRDGKIPTQRFKEKYIYSI